MFSPSKPMHVQLTVTWDKSHDTNKTHDATASWSEGVTLNGFKACVMVAGRHFNGLPYPPSINWIAYQTGFTNIARKAVEGGVVKMTTWYTGSRCQFIIVKNFNKHTPHVYTSIEHAVARNFKDAMTTWVEVANISSYNIRYRVCARELQNFDGVHKNINIHWLAVHTPVEPVISENQNIYFERLYVGNMNTIPTVCKVIPYNREYPALNNPTVILTGKHLATAEYSHLPTFSSFDISVWIESTNLTHMRVCYKSLRAGLYREEIHLSYALFPSMCDLGWDYHNGRCYTTLDGPSNYTNGKLRCKQQNANLPTIDSSSTAYYLETRAENTDTWIGLSRSLEDANWKWENGSSSSYRKWGVGKPDGGFVELCAAVDTGNAYRRGWDDRSCFESYKIVCEKDASINAKACASTCLNGAACVKNGTKTICKCAEGYLGNKCETNILEIAECRNYETHTESWRQFTNMTMAPLNRTCDRNFINSSWHRFSGSAGRKLLTTCTNSRNHCGVAVPGWLGGSHPNVTDGAVKRLIHFYSRYCASDYGHVVVRNCGSFYVYKFTQLPYWSCQYGLCTV